jgi:hypothetical protein
MEPNYKDDDVNVIQIAHDKAYEVPVVSTSSSSSSSAAALSATETEVSAGVKASISVSPHPQVPQLLVSRDLTMLIQMRDRKVEILSEAVKSYESNIAFAAHIFAQKDATAIDASTFSSLQSDPGEQVTASDTLAGQNTYAQAALLANAAKVSAAAGPQLVYAVVTDEHRTEQTELDEMLDVEYYE